MVYHESRINIFHFSPYSYVFGNDEAAEMAAIAYSLLGSCRLAKVYFQEWLIDVLNQIQGHSIQKLTELLPTHWRKNAI